MADSHICISSNTYKNYVFKGFSQLQQSDEFVDMTLAAGDQFVKVHKTLIALASPYLKTLLQAIPCQHPVLFLNNIKHEDLHFILEYIYSGEVIVPPEKLESFLIAAQTMHISGLETIVLPSGNETNSEPREENQATQVIPEPLQQYRTTKTFPVVKANITINENDFKLQIEPNTEISNVNNNSENPLLNLNNGPTPEENIGDLNAGIDTNNISANLCNVHENVNNDTDNVGIAKNPISTANIDLMPIVIDEMPQNLQRPFFNIGKAAFTITNTSLNNSTTNITIENSSVNNPTSFGNFFNIATKPSITENAPGNDLYNLDCPIASLTTSENIAVNQEQPNDDGASKDKGEKFYTVSNRGSLQLIMNRFMYYCHYTRDGGRKRRWRCIEYRDKRCPAAIDTDGETIVERKQKHCHPNHDKKIWNKVVKSRVFSSLRVAEDTVKEKQSLPKPVIEESLVISD